MTDRRLAIPHLDLLQDLLHRAGYERVVVEPELVEFGDYETLERYVVRDTGVAGWRGDRGAGDWTGVVFEDPDDAARWIATSAAGVLRDRAGLRRAHWLRSRPEELPEGMSLTVADGKNVLVWDVDGVDHRAWFGSGRFLAPAVQFATVARVRVDRIERCALESDSRTAFAAASAGR